jgi:hypothetical protein
MGESMIRLAQTPSLKAHGLDTRSVSEADGNE